MLCLSICIICSLKWKVGRLDNHVLSPRFCESIGFKGSIEQMMQSKDTLYRFRDLPDFNDAGVSYAIKMGVIGD
jgi:hypothetical protein